jgi:hypothetical protein
MMVLIQRRGEGARYKKHNKERILYINNKQELPHVPLYAYAANEVEFEDILSDNGQDEEEMFRFPHPLF